MPLKIGDQELRLLTRRMCRDASIFFMPQILQGLQLFQPLLESKPRDYSVELANLVLTNPSFLKKALDLQAKQ